MCKLSTNEAAELMLQSGGFFTAESLGEKVGMEAKKTTGLLYNIRTSNKYEVIETSLPNRKIKVVSISGRKATNHELWRLAFGLKSNKTTNECNVF